LIHRLQSFVRSLTKFGKVLSSAPPISKILMNRKESAVVLALNSAIKSAPNDLFFNCGLILPQLLEPSLIAQNLPLSYAVARNLIKYKNTGICPEPIQFPQMKGDTTAAAIRDMFKKHRALLESTDITNWRHLQNLIRTVGRSGIYLLCGLRQTKGTDPTLLPPPASALYDAFEHRHKGVSLTVGGRAFAKHADRDSAKFWGSRQGRNEFINEQARKSLDKIISNAIWHNIFFLPQARRAYEIRVPDGYGTRWELSEGKIIFRGFLEPMMEGGHEKRWRH
jgi:hypothetical protein